MLLYISSPFSSKEKVIQDERVEYNVKFIGAMFRCAQKLGTKVDLFAPVIQESLVYEKCNFTDEEKKYLYKNEVNWGILKKSDGMIVLMLEGWDKSRGVALEIEYCGKHNIPIYYLKYRDVIECSDKVKKLLLGEE